MKLSTLISRFNLMTATTLLLFSTLGASQTVSLSPNIGPPTTKTTASGSGFLPNATVRILFDRAELAQVPSDASGGFSKVSIQVPSTALPGKHSVLAGVSGGRFAQTTFLVRTNWSQFHFSADHKGFNIYENVLSPTTASGLQLLWSVNGPFFLRRLPTVFSMAHTRTSMGRMANLPPLIPRQVRSCGSSPPTLIPTRLP